MLRNLFFIALPAFFTRIILSASSGNKIVFDRGSRDHATGSVSGSTYIVAAGDTFYSIGLRFGLPYKEILRANNLPEDASVMAGYRLTIPGLQPTYPPVIPPPVKPPTGRPFLSINSPTPGSTLNPRYTVIITGSGANLRGGKVLVRIKDPRGITIKSQSTTIDVNGRWRVDFQNGLPVPPGSDGIIQAESPCSPLQTTVNIHYR